MVKFLGSNIDVIRRVNRPAVSDKVSLELFIINNGTAFEAYEVCSVYIFPQQIGNDPNGISIPYHYFVDGESSSTTFGLVASGAANTSADFVWSGGAGQAVNLPNSSSYDGAATTASSIYRMGTGHYAVVLQSDASCILSSVLYQNSASATGNYFDVWTIVNANGSNPQLYVNEFSLYDDTFVALVEPLTFTAKSILHTKRMKLGSIQNLIFGNSITVLNTNISDSIKSIIDKSVIDSAQVQILKYNEDTTLPNFVEVSGYAATSSLVQVTSKDTVSLLFNTNNLSGISNIGRSTGIYHARVKFTLFDQTIVSDEFPFIID